METNQPADILYNLVRSQLGENASLKDAEKQVHGSAAAAGITDSIVEEVLSRFRSELSPQEDSSEASPRLLVDWGELPRVGFQSRPGFSLICSGEQGEPKIRVTVDRELDHDPHDPQRRLQWEADGLWTFHVPFRLTHQGGPCLPGQYVINVVVSFRSTSTRPPRFYHTHIRLNIPDQTTEGDRVLEIDGDGQSVVNLHGHNLASFSKVVLKGGDQGIINLQSSGLETPDSEEGATATPNATFEYQLKVNHQKQSRLPVVQTVSRLPRNESISLRLESGKLIHLFAKNRLAFGRSRDNDVAIRFLPRSEEHDQLSRNISRTHMVVDCVDAGILIKDQSSKGIEINYEPVTGERLLTDQDVGYGLEAVLAGGILGEEPFSMELALFGGRGSDDLLREDQMEWDEICYQLLGERPGRLWQLAGRNGIDAVRLRRGNNAEDLEEYIALYREVQIGSSRSEDGITLCRTDHGTNVGRIFYAGHTFWVHTNPGTPFQLDEDLQNQARLIPIGPDITFSIGQEQIEVLQYEQSL